MAQVLVDGGEIDGRLRVAQQVAAHGDDLGGGAGGEVEAAEELLARAVDGGLQVGERALRGHRRVALGSLARLDRIRVHAIGEETQEGVALGGCGLAVALEDLAGDRHAEASPRPDSSALASVARSSSVEPSRARGNRLRPWSAMLPSNSCRKETFTASKPFSAAGRDASDHQSKQSRVTSPGHAE